VSDVERFDKIPGTAPSHSDDVPFPEGAYVPASWLEKPTFTSKRGTVEDLTESLIYAIGDDPQREGLVDTPKRVAKFWKEFISGDHTEWEVNRSFEAVQVDQMIVVKGIRGWSLCEHHLMPFSFVAHVGYITGERVIGLSKIPRIVVRCARRLQLQERLTNDIADALEEIVKPKGVAVVIEDSVHTCAVMRGIEAREMSFTTSCMRGVFLGNPVARAEFMELIK